MTTKNSPISKIRAQAEGIAKMLKAAERGEPTGGTFPEKVVAARQKADFVFTIAMDDKLLKVTMPWTTIRETTDAGLVEYIVSLMREEKPIA